MSAQGVDERMINVHYYYYYYDRVLCPLDGIPTSCIPQVFCMPTILHGMFLPIVNCNSAIFTFVTQLFSNPLYQCSLTIYGNTRVLEPTVRMQWLLSLITLVFWSRLYECKLYCLFSYNVLDHSPRLGSGLRRHRRSHQHR